MSVHLLKFLLSELGTVRLTCAQCQAVVEMATDKLDKRVGPLACPVCNSIMRGPRSDDDWLSRLAQAMRGAASDKERYSLEFVVPKPDPR